MPTSTSQHGTTAMRTHVDVDIGVGLRGIEAGAEHVGGLDPAGIDRDPVGQIDVILGISAEHGCGVDIHLHLLQAMAGLGMTFTTVAPLRLPQVVAGSFVAGHAQGAARSARRRTGAAGRAHRRPG